MQTLQSEILGGQAVILTPALTASPELAIVIFALRCFFLSYIYGRMFLIHCTSPLHLEKNVFQVQKMTDWILTYTEARHLHSVLGKSQSARCGLASLALGSVPGEVL